MIMIMPKRGVESTGLPCASVAGMKTKDNTIGTIINSEIAAKIIETVNAVLCGAIYVMCLIMLFPYIVKIHNDWALGRESRLS
jgi:hypothetical protein